jgi:hypothetical protein
MTGLRWRAAILSTLFVAALISLPISVRTVRAQALTPPASIAAPVAPADLNAAKETLVYDVEWRLIPAGTAKLNWTPMPSSAVAASEARLHLESSGLVSRLFRVNDDYSAMLAQNLCGGGTFMVAREGNRNKETRVTYDQQNRRANYTEKDLVKNSVVSQQVDTPACVHDVLGALMVLRTLRLEPGKSAQIPVSDGKKAAMVKVEAQRREEVSTPLGPRQAIRYEVFVFDNVIYKRSAHLHVWLTDDNVRLPVQLQVRLQFTIGTITFKLSKAERLPL